MYTVSIAELMDVFSLTLFNENVDIDDKVIAHPEINRPALQLAGFFDYFDADRLQIVGIVEHSYVDRMTEKERHERFKKLFSYNIPCIVICRGLEPQPEMLKYANDNNIPLLSSKDSTTDFMGEVIRWLKAQLAARVTMHGVLVDVYGEGILMLGESGVGKSEVALELVKRGHRLVADDAVEIKRVSAQTLVGSCPELIRYFIELRGIGIIDVREMYGVSSVKETQSIDLVIKLETWQKDLEYDRIGLHEEYMDILGNDVVCHTIPIRPGRNLAVICESAAINHRQKKMGYNAAQALQDRFNKNMEEKRAQR